MGKRVGSHGGRQINTTMSRRGFLGTGPGDGRMCAASEYQPICTAGAGVSPSAIFRFADYFSAVRLPRSANGKQEPVLPALPHQRKPKCLDAGGSGGCQTTDLAQKCHQVFPLQIQPGPRG